MPIMSIFKAADERFDHVQRAAQAVAVAGK